MSTNSIRIPFVDETSRATGSRFGGIRVYRANEGTTVTASKPKLDRMEVDLEKLMGIGYATNELLSDAPLMGELVVRPANAFLQVSLSKALRPGLYAAPPTISPKHFRSRLTTGQD